jgi:iron complex transport system ATP-binding protein
LAYQIAALELRYSAFTALHGLELRFETNQFTALAGPNGAGKSTLLHILAGLLTSYTGECRYEDKQVRDWPRRAFARAVSFVPQSVRIDFPFTAEEVVFMGRTPYAHGLYESDEDRAAVRRAMELTDCADFRCRDFRSLSGGERQRVILASALAQQPRVLLLDEPSTFLDLKHQVELYTLLRTLAGEGLCVIAVTHDLRMARAFAGRVVLLKQGTLAGDGPPETELAPDRIRQVFDVDVNALW